MALSTHIKGHLDNVAPGAAAKLVTVINSGSTSGIDRDLRSKLERDLGGIGEAAAFITTISTQGTLSIAAKQRLTNVLHGAGHVAELQTAITGQSA